MSDTMEMEQAASVIARKVRMMKAVNLCMHVLIEVDGIKPVKPRILDRIDQSPEQVGRILGRIRLLCPGGYGGAKQSFVPAHRLGRVGRRSRSCVRWFERHPW